MNICEECGRTFATPQGLGAHRTLRHRVSEVELQAIKADQTLKDGKIVRLESDVVEKEKWVRMLEAERQASACPHCGKLVGWSSLPIKECPLESYERGNPEAWCLVVGKVKMVKYRRCPICGHFEKEQRQ